MKTNEIFMNEAYDLALKGWGSNGLEPLQGCLIVENGTVVSSAWTADGSGDSAIIKACEKLGKKLDYGGKLFTTLEPVSRVYSNGSEVDAIHDLNVTQVIFGSPYPDSQYRGSALKNLKFLKVKTIGGVLKNLCLDLNLIHNYWKINNAPLIAAKVATTLDGKIATRTGKSKWITGEQARLDVMKWRQFFPGIAIGAKTLLEDNPSLTIRNKNGQDLGCPYRFIFDGSLSSVHEENLRSLNLFSDPFKHKTIVVTLNHAEKSKFKLLEKHAISYWVFQSDENNQVPFNEFINKCFQQKISGVLFEGGAKLIASLLEMKAIQYLYSYRAPKIFGDDQALGAFVGRECLSVNQAIELEAVHHEFFGKDQMIRGFVKYP